MSRPLRVFLCHASQDKPAVKKLYRYLAQRGGQPWLDELDLLPGQYWKTEIPRALFSSDVILVCLSKNSINKEGYVQKEIAFALDKAQEKPEGTIFIIPVKLEECEVPQRLSMYQWVEYFRADGRKRLLLSLNLRAAGLGGDVSPVLLDITHGRKPIESDSAKREAGEKAVREQTEREATEKLDREKAEQEAVAKALREKQQREQKEQTEREAAEKLARDKAEQKQKEIFARRIEEIAHRRISVSEPEKEKFETPKPKKLVAKSSPKFDPGLVGLGSIVLIALLFWGISAFLKDQPIANPQEQNTATATAPVLTKTPTKAPPTATNTSPSAFTPTLGIGSIYLSDGVTMLYVSAGTFSMGSRDEKPIHAVNLSAFYMDKYEVTNAAYKRCVEADVCDPPKQTDSYTRTAYYGSPEFDDYPVIYVDWNMAKTYCEWRGARLPTEAEWEKAARGADGRIHPWGNDISCDKANYCVGDTTKVGSYLDGVSPYGMYDMAGNVWEWVNDWYDDSYYSTSPTSNPQGPTSGQHRVLRGGAWLISDYLVHSATSRFWDDPTYTYYDIGFRCAFSHP